MEFLSSGVKENLLVAGGGAPQDCVADTKALVSKVLQTSDVQDHC